MKANLCPKDQKQWLQTQSKATDKSERTDTIVTSASHSLPTPINAWIPWASLKGPRGPVFMEVCTMSSNSLGKFSMLAESYSIWLDSDEDGVKQMKPHKKAF